MKSKNDKGEKNASFKVRSWFTWCNATQYTTKPKKKQCILILMRKSDAVQQNKKKKQTWKYLLKMSIISFSSHLLRVFLSFFSFLFISIYLCFVLVLKINRNEWKKKIIRSEQEGGHTNGIIRSNIG